MSNANAAAFLSWDTTRLISAASTNATLVRAGPTQIGFIYACNINAAACYLKLYNKASAPTVGTDTPVATLMVPGSTAGAGFSLPIPGGTTAYPLGLSFAITTGIADSDTTGVAANEVVVWIGYA
jgi:hypothetical protein